VSTPSAPSAPDDAMSQGECEGLLRLVPARNYEAFITPNDSVSCTGPHSTQQRTIESSGRVTVERDRNQPQHRLKRPAVKDLDREARVPSWAASNERARRRPATEQSEGAQLGAWTKRGAAWREYPPNPKPRCLDKTCDTPAEILDRLTKPSFRVSDRDDRW